MLENLIRWQKKAMRLTSFALARKVAVHIGNHDLQSPKHVQADGSNTLDHHRTQRRGWVKEGCGDGRLSSGIKLKIHRDIYLGMAPASRTSYRPSGCMASHSRLQPCLCLLSTSSRDCGKIPMTWPSRTFPSQALIRVPRMMKQNVCPSRPFAGAPFNMRMRECEV